MFIIDGLIDHQIQTAECGMGFRSFWTDRQGGNAYFILYFGTIFVGLAPESGPIPDK
ncbi:hypothetical protein D3C76_1305390 [compost metagenome]